MYLNFCKMGTDNSNEVLKLSKRRKNNAVLIIEDDREIANMFKAYLSLFGLKVTVAYDGSKRTQLKIKKMRFSVVVAAIDLGWAPEIEGMEAVFMGGIQSGVVLITKGGFVDKSISTGFYRHFGQKILLEEPFSLHELKKTIFLMIENIEAEGEYFSKKYFKS